jgi:hypothetical protein
MEVIEIDSHFINKDSNMLSVDFRTNADLPNQIRTDVIEYEYVTDFGYGEPIGDTFLDEFEDEEDEWDFEDDDVYMDEETLLSFLNEYYVVFPERLPEAETL